MTFTHPFALLLVALPLAYGVYAWPRTSRRAALCLKMFSFAAIFLAFSEPAIRMPETKTGVVVLVDASASISNTDLGRSASLINAMAQARGGNWMRVVPFARQARALKPEEIRNGWRLERTAREEAPTWKRLCARGYRQFRPGASKLVLISDGRRRRPC